MQKQTVAAQNQTFQNSEPQILNLIAAIVVEPLKELWSNYWGPNPVTRYKKNSRLHPTKGQRLMQAELAKSSSSPVAKEKAQDTTETRGYLTEKFYKVSQRQVESVLGFEGV